MKRTEKEALINNAWIRGVAYAVAEINRLADQPSLAKEILRNAGLGASKHARLTALQVAQTPDFDLKELRKCL